MKYSEMPNTTPRSSCASLADRNGGLAGPAIRAPASFTFKLFVFAIAVVVFLFFTHSLLFTSSANPSDLNFGLSSGSYGFGLIRRMMLEFRSNPLRPRLHHIRKQAQDRRSLIGDYAIYARKLKLDNLKIVTIFAALSVNYTNLISKPAYQALFDPDSTSIDESVLRQLEKEVKERIKFTRQIITEAKKSFDNQLKIQKLKDTR